MFLSLNLMFVVYEIKISVSLRKQEKKGAYSFVSFVANLEQEINCLFYALNRFKQFISSTAGTINFRTFRFIIVLFNFLRS